MTGGLLLGTGSAIFTYDLIETATETVEKAEKDIKVSIAKVILELNII